MSWLILLLACGDGGDSRPVNTDPGRVFVPTDGGPSIAPSPDLEAAPACDAACPEGTQAVRAETGSQYTGLVDGGAFVFVEGTCESLCSPIQPCFPPSVPVVTEAGFVCEALAGFSTIPASVDVNLDFGLVWDAAEHTP